MILARQGGPPYGIPAQAGVQAPLSQSPVWFLVVCFAWEKTAAGS